MHIVKILAICGSHHKGKCYSVLNTIKENYPTFDFKLLMLKDVNLQQCRGCYVCIAKGEQYCPLKDDRDMLIKEITDADGVIFASSVYVNTITSLMKQFMERVSFITHRPRLFDKYAMVMAICRGFGADKANEYMNDIFSSFGFNVVPSLELQFSTKNEEEKKYNHEKTIKAFNTLIARIEKGERNKPTMTQLVMFNLFKTISELNKEYFEADYQYYKDKTDFYYDTKLNFFKKTLAKRIVKKEIKKIMNPSLR